jgi:hypothetical protein
MTDAAATVYNTVRESNGTNGGEAMSLLRQEQAPTSFGLVQADRHRLPCSVQRLWRRPGSFEILLISFEALRCALGKDTVHPMVTNSNQPFVPSLSLQSAICINIIPV